MRPELHFVAWKVGGGIKSYPVFSLATEFFLKLRSNEERKNEHFCGSTDIKMGKSTSLELECPVKLVTFSSKIKCLCKQEREQALDDLITYYFYEIYLIPSRDKSKIDFPFLSTIDWRPGESL